MQYKLDLESHKYISDFDFEEDVCFGEVLWKFEQRKRKSYRVSFVIFSTE